MQRKKSEIEKRKEALFRELINLSGTNTAEGAQNLVKEMLSGTLQQMLESEMDENLGYCKYDYRNKETDNSRNRYHSKSLETSNGEIELNIPRDRNDEFEPKIVPKYQTRLTSDIEDKIISMYAKGMTQSDIASCIMDLYGFEISDASISKITDKILPVAKEWQNRPLDSVYAMVFTDAMHYRIRSEGRTKSKTIFPSDDSLFKMLYLATMEITKKWTGVRPDWKPIYMQEYNILAVQSQVLAGKDLTFAKTITTTSHFRTLHKIFTTTRKPLYALCLTFSF